MGLTRQRLCLLAASLLFLGATSAQTLVPAVLTGDAVTGDVVGTTIASISQAATSEGGVVTVWGACSVPGSGIQQGFFVSDNLVRPVVRIGQSAPGLSGVTFQSLGINYAAGGVPAVFRGVVQGPGIVTANADGLWRQSAGSLVELMRTQQLIPGLAGGYVSSFQSDDYVSVSSSGDCVFRVRLAGPGVTVQNDSALLRISDANAEIILREGDPATGLNQAIFQDLGTSFSLQALAGGDISIVHSASNNSSSVDGIWRWHDGSMSQVVARGSQAPEAPDGVTYLPPDYILVSSDTNGSIYFGGELVPLAEQAIWRNSGSSTELLLRSGNAAPDVSGGEFDQLYAYLAPAAYPMDSGFAIRATLRLGGEINSGNSEGVWVFTQSLGTKVIRLGDAAPGVEGAVISHFDTPLVGRRAIIIFGRISGANITFQNDEALWYWSASSGLVSVWREGDQAPGEAVGVQLKAPPVDAVLIAGDQLLATGHVEGPGIFPNQTIRLWAFDPVRGLRSILRAGDGLNISRSGLDLRVVSNIRPVFDISLSTRIFPALSTSHAVIVDYQGGSGAFTLDLSPPCDTSIQTPSVARAVEGMRTRVAASISGTLPSAWNWLESGQVISDNQTFAGAMTPRLTLLRPAIADDGRAFVARATLDCGTVESNSTSLSVVRRADWDGNGGNDIVWRNAVTGVNLLWKCDGTPSDSTFVIGTSSFPTVADRAWTIVGQGDVNQDGLLDLVWRNTATGDNSVWLMNGTAYAGAIALPRVADANWEIRGVADLNRDGIADLLWRNRRTGVNVIWYMNEAFTGTIGTAGLPSVIDPNWQIEGVADFNGDGDADVLWRNARTAATAVWYVSGSTVLGAGDVSPMQTDVAWRVLSVQDYNNDGKPDIAWRNTLTGVNELWLMNGVQRASVVQLPSVSDTSWRGMGQARFRAGVDGDFNGDGSVDIMWRNPVTGANSVWLMNGTQYSGAVNLIPIGDPNWRIQATSDLTRDNQTDVFWRNIVTGQNVLWQMSGTNRIASIDLPGVSDTSWYVGACADIDGDEMTDLVWYNTSTRGIVVWYLNPNRNPFVRSTATLPTQSASGWRLRGAGDLNVDGRTDLFFRGSSSNEAWLLNGATRTGTVPLPSVSDPNWDIRSISDFDRDGIPDVLWRNSVTGANTIWLMNGASIRTSVLLPTVADGNWQIAR